jgi:signal transduction histidine kinase
MKMRLIPNTIAARTLLVLVIGLTISHVLSVGLYFRDRATALKFTGGEHIAERIAIVGGLAANASASERHRIVQLADGPMLHVSWSTQSAIEDQEDRDWQANVLRDALVAHLNAEGGQIFRLRHSDDGPAGSWQTDLRQDSQGGAHQAMLMVSLQLPDRSWLNFAAPVESPEPFWSIQFVLSMVVMLLAVGITAALVVHHLTRPLSTFAGAAQRLGRDVNAPSLPESGPAEVRQAIRAFNEMQERIRRFVEDRTQMLAAISHDLGTPITRLRLRAEFVEDTDQQEKMLADLDDMERMVASAMSFARDQAGSEARAVVDLRTLLQRVCDDLADAGHAITLDVDEDAIAFSCQPAAMRRAFTNLIDNATKYGRRARVSLERGSGVVLVTIDDDGPGIPECLQKEAFKPFRRLEESRNRETGGTGLGLTVARTIVRAHGGDIRLANRNDGGLRVEVRLPP